MWKHPEKHPGEFLRKRFLEPLGLSSGELARRCRMPRSRIADILAGKRAISADTAKRLAALFRMDPEAWMALQAAWELHQVELDNAIAPLDPPGFLLGPSGATPIPAARRPRPLSLHVPEDFEASVAEEREPEQRRRRQHEEVRYADGTRALVSRPT
jgi:addiction module HigA family antidote